MNHLREFLETLKEDGIDYSVTINDHDTLILEKHMLSRGRGAVCFWLGDGDQYMGAKGRIRELGELPFDDCWFEWDWVTEKDGYFLLGMICSKNKDGSKSFQIVRKKKDKWTFILNIDLDKDFSSNGVFTYLPDDGGIKYAQLMIGLIFNMLMVINCCNVNRVKVEPSAKLQRAREKNNKLPFFSYWTLFIGGEPLTGANNGRGGAHQSPRHHIRRGHARQYAPGKYTWVSPCMVGNKELGTIHKDYSMKAST